MSELENEVGGGGELALPLRSSKKTAAAIVGAAGPVRPVGGGV